MPPKVVAEYAKSNRSSCKKCSKTIAANALRLGSVTRDSRGFDMTKWHHVDCFPIVSEPIDSADSIQGFSSLQSADQEALKTLVTKCQTSLEEFVGTLQAFDGSEGNSKGLVVQKTDEDEEEVELESTNSKKRKADGLHDSKKIAAFDFDGCLVKTNVKRVGADAWSLMYPSVPDKLQSLYNDGYKLVIFTNEANIERWKNKRQIAVDSKLGRLNNFIKCVKVPIQVFVACGIASGKAEDPFRKPKPGISFYVGDAAGRKNDHSDADIQFAKQLADILQKDFQNRLMSFLKASLVSSTSIAKLEGECG
ncbi:polynucleotide 3'-phosphatase ZDP [Citrus sinensis]|uniref:Polynucleotide 3'-phosphatase ZDP n=1 Tax=Citrus sinensis TaxID=2711 RepID=A0ACB8M006_CITSI|nr:polynucleotide 3'-phosphatase ZDP [Citrus sinensis]